MLLAVMLRSHSKSIRREVSERMCPPLVNDHHVLQRALEQQGVEMIKSRLESAVLNRRDGRCPFLFHHGCKKAEVFAGGAFRSNALMSSVARYAATSLMPPYNTSPKGCSSSLAENPPC